MTVNPSDWVQVLPETGSDDRVHVLDDTCWCKPTLTQVVNGHRFGYRLVHRRAPYPKESQ